MERAIKIFKDHFIAGFSIVNRNYLVLLWDYNILHAEIMLNLLCTSKIHQHLSTYQHLLETYDYNKIPVCLSGKQVVVHMRPEIWASWGLLKEEGWYIRTALKHYQCHQVYVTKKEEQN